MTQSRYAWAGCVRACCAALFALIVLGGGLAGCASERLGAVARDGPSAVDRTSFSAWIDGFWPTARKAGIGRETYTRAFSGVTPDPEVLRLANRQAEFTQTAGDYITKRVSPVRIAGARRNLSAHGPLLNAIEVRYGVDRYVVLAIWGIETHYGAVLSNRKIVRNVIRSLATLAWRGGKRRAYGRSQLIGALKILEAGDVAAADMTGSWAGAMGHTQFIPTSFHSFAVDFDGDGRRNIWTSIADALASSARYLRDNGWRAGETWGYEVTLAPAMDFRLANNKTVRTIREWARLGVQRPRGRPFPRMEDRARLFLPSGARGPAFLLLRNFDVILTYNRSTSYGLAVGHLADRARGGGPFFSPWPKGAALSIGQLRDLQSLLTAGGFSPGPIDGKLGTQTRVAIRAFQISVGLTPDGYPSRKLLARLKRGE